MNTPTKLSTRQRNEYGYGDLHTLMSRMTGDEKHSASATSTLDALWTLYDRVLRVDSSRPDDPLRDRFILSKGHGPMAYYAVLAAKGFFEHTLLDGFGTYDSPLGLHPDRILIPGVDTGSGSLGHGLPLALGQALALRAKHQHQSRIFVLLGDAEFDEGSNQEAIALAARLSMQQLTAIVIDNRSSAHGWPGGIETRFTVEGWSAVTVSGRDHDALEAAFERREPGKPHCVVATVESKGD